MTKLLGFSHKKGTSTKTGNPYDFYILAFSSDADTNYIGEYVFEENVKPDAIGIDDNSLKLKIGHECEICYMKNGNYLNVASIKFK